MKKLITLLLLLPVLAFAQTYPSPTYNNLQVNTGLSIGPTPTSLAKAVNVSQTMTGTPAANCTTTTLIMYPCANLYYVASDDVSAGLTGSSAYDTWQFATNFGGPNLTGARQGLDVIAHFTAPSNPANVNAGYEAFAAEMITNSGDNGTAPTTANGKGSFFAANFVAIANSGAQNLFGLAGMETNVGCNGCSTAIRYGVSITQFGTTQAAVLGNDAAVHIGSIGTGTTGSWHQAINLSNANGGAPLDGAGCVICTDASANTIATGIDLSSYTISGNFLRGPGGGFVVTGSGSVTANGVSTGAGGLGTSGGLTVSAGGASIAGGLSSTGTITPSQTNGIVGTTTNNNVIAGGFGEYLTATTAGTALTNNTGAACTSISLTAGDWDVSGSVSFAAAAGTTISALEAGISTTTSLGALGTANANVQTYTTATTNIISTPVVRESLAGTTTINLVGLASFGVSTMTCSGFIRARRVR